MRISPILKKLFLSLFVVAAFTAVNTLQVRGQSQALNGQIEGIVTDTNGGAVAGANVTARNIGTGTERSTVTDDSGVYRFPLLPLGTYQVTVEAANFKRLVREGITLTAGQTATLNLPLEAGDVSATVTVNADTPIADPGKIDVGRVMNTREVQDLPLVSRNPYNFSLLQANVVGRPNTEFGVPRVSANGYARRTNFQLDGNVNTQANQAGLRLVPISDTFVSEVQLVTNGFSAEFGNTPGLVMNNITPSGTNGFHGSGSYRFRRTWMSSRPFNISPTAPKPPTTVDDLTGAIGGPIIKDRWHFYGGYEWVKRDFSGRPAQQTSFNTVNQPALVAAGLPSDIFVSSIPASQKVNFFIFRTDAQLTKAHRLTGRFIRFTNFSPNNIGGLTGSTPNTLQRTVDLDDKSNSLAIQFTSILSSEVFNEFRYQRAHRNSQFLGNEFTPANAPSVTITNVAAFGPPTNLGTISPIETMNQFQDNLTWTRGDHAMKFGGGLNRIYDYRRNDINALYTFPTLASYLAAIAPAATDAQRRGYTTFSQTLGDAEIEYNSTFYNFFGQDDWKATRKLKINYGLRYDLYDVPNGNPDSPIAGDRDFKVDKNNFAPRLGLVYSLRDGNRPTVIRGSAGIYYDTVYLAMYENAIQGNGTGRYLNVSRTPSQTGAPLFPNVIPTGTSLSSLGITQNAEEISPGFENMYAMHYQAQIEQALTNDLSITVGYIHSEGRHLPTYRQTNCVPNPAEAPLADGRPVYGRRIYAADGVTVTGMTPCVIKVNPAFNNIITVESGGNSNYNALTLQLNKRFSQGIQFSLNYTLSRARDNAPERNLQGVGAATVSDPSNRNFDWAYGVADQRHTFSGSIVARPNFKSGNRALRYILNNNQFGFFILGGSGETFPITTNFDLNGDGVGNDLPVGLERNGGRAPGFFDVDARYSRVIPITERFRIELFAEATNLFNTNSTVSYGTGTTLGSGFNRGTGALITPINYANFAPTAQESRQGQFGIKFIF
jgi:hypothetical protein